MATLTERILLISSLLIGFIGNPAQAASGIQFFRSPQSLFPSGEASHDKLRKSAKSTEFIFDYLIESQNKKHWLPASALARDIDVSAKVTYRNQDYWLKEMRGYWALVERISDGKRDWTPLLELRPAPQDIGKALTLISTSLRSEPRWTADLILQLPPKTALHIIDITESWVRVQFESVVGYVDINNVLMKADFASEVQNRDGEWFKSKYREGFQMILDNNRTLAISKISGWKTNEARGVLLENLEEKKLLRRQNLKIEKIQAQVWTMSNLAGHGRVFWNSTDSKKPASKNELTLTAEELLKRDIFSVAFDLRNPKIGIVSSHGIFKSIDGGLTWTGLSAFKTENHPVSIGPDGSWYVGFVKSRDQGVSFTQYLRTDFLAKLVQSQSRYAPPTLRISEIGFLHSQMQIKVETGTKTLRLATKSTADNITEWDFL